MNIADLGLPKLLAVACKAGGFDAVQRLAEALGGKLVYIPSLKACTDNHILVQAGGRAAADALCAAYGPSNVEFPRATKTLKLYLAAALFAEGKSNNQVADTLGCSWREARRLKKRLRGKDPVARALAQVTNPPKKEELQLDLEDYLRSTAKKSKR